jgi:hypothetical protein
MSPAVQTQGEGSAGNTSHLNLTSPLKRYRSGKLASYHHRLGDLEARRAQTRYAHTLAEIRLRRVRLAMIVAELASLGCYQHQIAKMVHVSDTQILILSREFKIKLPTRKLHDTPLCRAVREGYAQFKTPSVIAAEVGTTEMVVRATASKMKITNRAMWRDQARGFTIPEDRRTEYRELTKLGCTPREAGMCMGLLPRTKPTGDKS